MPVHAHVQKSPQCSLLMVLDSDVSVALSPLLTELFSEIEYVSAREASLKLGKKSYTMLLADKDAAGEYWLEFLSSQSPSRKVVLLDKRDFPLEKRLKTEINRMLLKPVEIEELVTHLADELKSALFDTMMEEKRRAEVISKNKIRQIDKLMRADFPKHDNEMILRMQNRVQSLQDSCFAYVLDETNTTEELEQQINDSLDLIVARNSGNPERFYEVGILFRQYSCMLFKEQDFDALSGGILELSQMLLDVDERILQENRDAILSYLESFVYTLMRRRQELNAGHAESLHFYDQSMLADLFEVNSALAGMLEGNM